ncbi:uncharacterized protein J3D65DRAFT_651330 [Phyllosticta citribraziliensis]|uniref:Pre-mRNA-splicing factor 38B n=1 Tax=Phyllosticta citribraziliensis TaxID=989973 RepID=A0ABR1LT92_9PEZI
MPADDPTDDYVAELLKKDAKASSNRYEAVGLEAVLPKRPTSKAPKPNTRFLRNILRETDSHNAALLAKEEAEAKARLTSLKNKRAPRDAKSILGKDLREAEKSRRGRQERPSKRQRVDASDDDTQRDGTSKRRHDAERSSHSSKYESTRDRDSRGERRKHHDFDAEDADSERRSRHHRKSHRDRDRSLSEGQDGERRHRTERSRRERQRSTSVESSRERRHKSRRREDHSEDRRRRRDDDTRRRKRPRSYSPDRSRSRSKNRHESRRKRRSSSVSSTRAYNATDGRRSRALPTKSRITHGDDHDDSDTDPLEEILGPMPPSLEQAASRPRGRGATNFNNTIDKHFAADYDPSQDVRVDSEEEDDWDMALEALRDRQKWKQQGAERLKAAGFTDEEIEKWASGKEKSEEDVRWRKKGEAREWDRGKVIGEDGFVDLKAEWGRLKGT